MLGDRRLASCNSRRVRGCIGAHVALASAILRMIFWRVSRELCLCDFVGRASRECE